MLELKNKIYNSKKRKKQERFNKKMELIKKIRLKTKNIVPLSKNEELLYCNRFDYNESIEKEDDGKYLNFNKRMHILTVISKTEIDNFYNNYSILVKENPCKNGFIKIVLDDKGKDNILNFKNKINYGGWCHLGYITPKSPNLEGIVDYIYMSLFDLSDDYVGINFTITLNNEFNDELNKFMISDIDNENNYNKSYIGNRRHIGMFFRNKKIVRKEKLDDILLEIKMRCFDFLNSYINMFPINNNSPITLDEYSTDYDFDDRNSFIINYDFYIPDKKYISHKLDIVINNIGKKNKQKFEEIDFYLDFEHNSNRSCRLLINVSKNEKDNFFFPNELVSIYKCILIYHLNNELEENIRNKRKILNELFNSENYNIYDKYIGINKIVNTYNSILNNSKILKTDGYSDERILNIFEHQYNKFKDLISKNKDLDSEFTNVLMAKNNKFTLILSSISLIVAIISLLLTIFYSIISY